MLSYAESFFTNEDTFDYMTEADEKRVSGGNKLITIGSIQLGVSIGWCNFNDRNRRRCTNAGREHIRFIREIYPGPICRDCIAIR